MKQSIQKDADGGKLGVSSGFLSSIAQSEGTNGVKLNLNVDTIQSIFRTYPAGFSNSIKFFNLNKLFDFF